MTLISTPPLSAEVDAALTRLETTETFAGHQADYTLIEDEARRRSMPAFFAMLPSIAVFALVILALRGFGLVPSDSWGYALWLLIVPFAAVVTNALRGSQAVKDEQRIGKVLNKWRDQAGVDAVSKRT